MRLRSMVVALLVTVAAGAIPFAAIGITGGSPDGNGHPYVADVENGSGFCSGTLISPTVLVTAAHCFTATSWGTNSVTGAPQVIATFDPTPLLTPREDRVWWTGSYYPDPAFGAPGHGLPGFSTHDTAIVVFSSDGCQYPQTRTELSTVARSRRR